MAQPDSLTFALLKKDVVDGQRHPGAFPSVPQFIRAFWPWCQCVSGHDLETGCSQAEQDPSGETDSTHPQWAKLVPRDRLFQWIVWPGCTRNYVSALITVVSSFTPRLGESPMLEAGEWLQRAMLPELQSHVFEGSVMVMVYITQYGILILFRHQCICMLMCSKWQKHPQNHKKSVLPLLREDLLPGPKEALKPLCTQGTCH